MRKYELSLTTDYVSDWTYAEAVREIFQNAIDAGNYEWDYDATNCKLTVSNIGACLEPKTLLLGCTTKKGDSSTIGQFGEGYKIALLVLAREGRSVTIYNGLSKEVWTARLVNSKRYGTQVLTIFVDKLSIWEKAEDRVTFEIADIAEEEFETIKSNNLHINPPQDPVLDTYRGQILLNKDYAGRIYVNGLYVCTESGLTYGYNLKPDYITLDRDRKTLRTYDVMWETSYMWCEVGGDLCVDLCFKGANDVQYIPHSFRCGDVKQAITNRFIAKYGENAYPCVDQESLDVARSRFKKCSPVVVPSVVYHMIEASCNARLEQNDNQLTLKERFSAWYAEYVTDMATEGEIIWNNLLDELE